MSGMSGVPSNVGNVGGNAPVNKTEETKDTKKIGGFFGGFPISNSGNKNAPGNIGDNAQSSGGSLINHVSGGA